MSKYIEMTFAEVRKKVLESGLTEEEFRSELYRDNPENKIPDKELENLIYQIYHSSSPIFKSVDEL